MLAIFSSKLPYLVAAQHNGELSRQLRERDVLDRPVLAERGAVEEAQPADRLVERRPRHALLVDEVDLVATDVLLLQLVGRLAVVLRELGDGVDVRLLRPWGVVAYPEVFEHSFVER